VARTPSLWSRPTAYSGCIVFGGDGNRHLDRRLGQRPAVRPGGNDTRSARAASTCLFGGDGNDTLTGGVGDDQVFEAGNDRMI